MIKKFGLVLVLALFVSGCFEDPAAKRQHEFQMKQADVQMKELDAQKNRLDFEKHKFDKLAELCKLFLENNAGKGTGCNFK